MQKIFFSKAKTLKSSFFAVYGDHKEFHHKSAKKVLRKKKIFSLSIKKPFELKFMLGRLKLYLRRDVYILEKGKKRRMEEISIKTNTHSAQEFKDRSDGALIIKIMEWKAKTTTYRKDSDRFVTANSVRPEKKRKV